MPPPGTPPDMDVARLIERQLRNWELARALPPAPEPAHKVELHAFITISRMVGADGRRLANALSAELGWPVFDREILQAMSGDDAIRAQLFEHLDERDVGWVEDTLRWLVAEGASTAHYAHRLHETILALARKGPAIFVGRGAHLILPHHRGLRIHLIAPLTYCAENLAARFNLTMDEARTEVERIQQERSGFLRRQFGARANDPLQYDLVLNAAQFDLPQLVALVLLALRSREPAV
ncbi:MAG: cytidylate kinase-like family protein [Phycisphaerales bacterium]|nr:cytidylate kinase-like family protein [Phycisphaerales bacterium]